MTSRATQAAFDELHAEIAKQLKAKLATEEFSASDMANAIKFCKDNGTDSPAPAEGNPKGEKLVAKLQAQTDKEKAEAP